MEIPSRPDLLQLWGIVSRATHDPELRSRPGAVTQNIFNAYQQSYLEAGQQPPALSIFEVNQLRSLASRQYLAERNLAGAIDVYQRTGFDQAIDSTMLAPDIDTGPGAGYAYPGQTRIRFQITTEVDGVPVTRWVTYMPGIEGPSSVASMMDMLDVAGEGFAEDYGEVYSGLGDQFSVTYV